MSTTAQRLSDNNISVPNVSAPAAAYVPYTISGNTLYISGQLPMIDGEFLHKGHLGKNISIEQGQEAAHACALNILAHASNALDGDLDRVEHVLKLEILVAATPEFTEPHVVANGASNLIKTVFGDEVGSHARVAYGVATLPFGVSVEVAATFEIA